MTKLLKSHRTVIVDRLLAPGRTAREAVLKRRENALALRATKARFGDDVFARCRALPEGWVDVHKRIQIYGCDTTLPRYVVNDHRYSYTKPDKHIELAEAVPLPNAFMRSWSKNDFGRFWPEVVDLFQARCDLHTELTSLAQQLAGTLAGFTTVERLAEDWPEAYRALPQELLAPAAVHLPAAKLDDLNARLAALREAA
jgi:hypothetical protein